MHIISLIFFVGYVFSGFEKGFLHQDSLFTLALAILPWIWFALSVKYDAVRTNRISERNFQKQEHLFKKKTEWLKAGRTDHFEEVEVETYYTGDTKTSKFGGRLNEGGWTASEVVQFLSAHGVRDEDFGIINEKKMTSDTEHSRLREDLKNQLSETLEQQTKLAQAEKVNDLRQAFPDCDSIHNWLIRNLSSWVKEQLSGGRDFPLELNIRYHKELKSFAMKKDILKSFQKLELPIDDKYGPFVNHTQNEIFELAFKHSKHHTELLSVLNDLGIQLDDYSDKGIGQILKFVPKTE